MEFCLFVRFGMKRLQNVAMLNLQKKISLFLFGGELREGPETQWSILFYDLSI